MVLRGTSVVADLELPSVYQLSDVAYDHGFRVPLFNGLLSRLWPANRPVSVDITTTGGIVLAKGLQAYRPDQSMKKSPYEGYLDTVTDATVRGWAWMPHSPAERLDLTVYLDGCFYTRLSANAFRADIAEHGIGSGDYAFSLRISERFRGGEAHQVDVLIADTGIPLKGSPMTINRRGQSQIVA